MSYVIPTYAVQPITIPDVSLVQDGVMTSAMLKQLQAGTAIDDVLISVPSASYPTLDDALAALPAANEGQCKIFLDPGAYSADFSAFNPPTPVGPKGTPLAIIGSLTDEVGTITESIGGDPSTITDPALALAVNAYEGVAYLLCTSGANVGLRCQVRRNTATTITVMGSFFFGPIVANDTFILQKPAVTVNATGDFNAWKRIFGFVNLQLNLPGGVTVRQCSVSMQAVVVDGGGSGFHEWFPHNGIFSAGFSAGSPWEADGPNNPFDFLNFFAGTLFQNIPAFAGSDSLWDGTFFWKDGSSPSLDGCDLFMPNVETDNCPLTIGQGSHVSYFGSIFGGRAAFDNSPTDGVIYDGCVGSLTDHDITNSAGDAVKAQNNALVTLDDVGGSTNGGAGIHPQQRSQIFFAAGLTAVTGTAGDTLVDGVAQNYAAVTPDGYNGTSGAVLTFNRVSPQGL